MDISVVSLSLVCDVEVSLSVLVEVILSPFMLVSFGEVVVSSPFVSPQEKNESVVQTARIIDKIRFAILIFHTPLFFVSEKSIK